MIFVDYITSVRVDVSEVIGTANKPILADMYSQFICCVFASILSQVSFQDRAWVAAVVKNVYNANATNQILPPRTQMKRSALAQNYITFKVNTL